jgi:hypothetical protein
MYVSLEDFKQNVQKYMYLAKKVDLLIVDATNTTIWTMRCHRDTLQARLAKTIRDSCQSAFRRALSAEGPYKMGIFH